MCRGNALARYRNAGRAQRKGYDRVALLMRAVAAAGRQRLGGRALSYENWIDARGERLNNAYHRRQARGP